MNEQFQDPFGVSRAFVSDSFRNLMAGLGVPGRDKVMAQVPHLCLLNPKQLEDLYRGDWIARKVVDIPAFDATRAWRQWDAEQDEVEKLQNAERSFGLQKKLLDALVKARLYGGAALILGVKGSPFNEELDLDKVKKGDLKFVHVVQRWMLGTGPRVRDITSPWFGEPEWYQRSNVPMVGGSPGGVTPLEKSSLGYDPGNDIYIHPSRVVRLVGLEYPDIEHANDAWGDSALQPVYEAIRDAGLVTQAMANVIADSKVDIYKVPGLTGVLSTEEGTNKMTEGLSYANVAKSTVNALVIDKEIDWERIQTRYHGMQDILQTYLLIAAAAADIPSTRMLSREPAGQNATGDSDTRNYYDRLHADQTVRMTPLLNRLDEVLIRHTFGKRDPDLKYEWSSLWQASDDDKAKTALAKAQAFKIDVDTALIPPQALQKARENQLIEDGTYPGLDDALEEVEAAYQSQDVPEEDATGKLNEQPPPGKPKATGANGNGANGGAPKEQTAKGFADDLSGGGQSGLSFPVVSAAGGRRRRKPFRHNFSIALRQRQRRQAAVR